MLGQVGFIGMGVMGAPMARNIAKAGLPVKVYNRNREKLKSLVEEGITVASSLRELGESCDIICTCVTDSRDVEEVLFGPGGALGERPVLVVDFSTIAPAEARRISQRLNQAGHRFLDAPVTGGDVGARNGTLTVMVGGDERDIEKARPVFEAVGKRLFHMGQTGAGQLMKCVNQIAVALNVTAMSEAIVFAEREGLNPAQALSVLKGGAAGSTSMELYGERVLKGDFAPGFAAKHLVKDLGFVLAETARLDVILPGTETACRLFGQFCEAGGAEMGIHGLKRLFETKSPTKRD